MVMHNQAFDARVPNNSDLTAEEALKLLDSIQTPHPPVPPGDAEAQSGFETKLKADLKALILSVLKMEAEDFSEHHSWMDYGLDSVASTELATRFQSEFKITLPPTIFFEFQNLSSFARYLAGNHRNELAARYSLAAAIEAFPSAIRLPLDDASVPQNGALGRASAEQAARVSGARDIEELWSEIINAPAGQDIASKQPQAAPSAPQARASQVEPSRDRVQSRQPFVDAARLVSVKRSDGSAVEGAVYGEGLPVLLLGGLLMEYSVMWRMQLEELGKRHRLIMFHMPGSGGVPLHEGVTLKSLTRDIAELLDALGIDEPLPVAGYSFGGVLAQAFCLDYPQRCAALSASVSTPSAEGADDFRALMTELQKSPLFMEYNRSWPMKHLAAYEQIARGFDFRPRLGEIRVPALIIAAGQDRYMPAEYSRSIAAGIPGARFHEFPDAGHLAGFTHADEWNALLLEFLASVNSYQKPQKASAPRPGAPFLPASPSTLKALEAYVANGETGHCVALAPQAAQAALVIDALCNEGKAEKGAYHTYFLPSGAEALDTALRFVRHYARNKNAQGGGAILVIDRSMRWRDYFDPAHSGPDDALVPGITFVADLAEGERALTGGSLANGIVAVAFAADASHTVEEAEEALAFAERMDAVSILIDASSPSVEPSQWFCRRIRQHPGAVVLGEAITGHQAPAGACVVNGALRNPWAMTPNEGYVRHPMTNFGLTLKLAFEYLSGTVSLTADQHRELLRIASSQQAAYEAHLRYGNAGYARVARVHGYDARFTEARGRRSRAAAPGEPSREIIDCLSNVGTALRDLNPQDVIERVVKVHNPGRDYWSDLEEFIGRKTGFTAALPATSFVAGFDAALTLGLLANPGRRKLVCFSGGAAFSLASAATAHHTATNIVRNPFEPLYPHSVFIDPTAPDAKERLDRELSAGDVAMVWLETIQFEANAGRLLPRELVETVVGRRTSGGYLIGVDEGLTGLSTGRIFHSEGLIPSPDLVLMGSALCDSLLPAAAVLTSKALLAKARRANPARIADIEERGRCQLAAHIALNALEDVYARDLMGQAAATGAYFKQRLEALARELPVIREVRGEGLLLIVQFDLSGQSAFVRQSFGYLLWGAMFRDEVQGVTSVVCPLHNDCIRLVPPLTITREEVDSIVDNLRRTLAAGAAGIVHSAAEFAAKRGDSRTANFLKSQIPAGVGLRDAAAGAQPAPARPPKQRFQRAAPKPGLPRVCIIGAGVAGICMAKQLMERGVPFDIYDKRDRPGGIWAYDAERKHTSVWHAMNMNTPRGRYQFSDFPMPESYPDFPQHQQTYQYLQNYIDHFGFRDRICLNTEVKKAARLPDGSWEILLDTGERVLYDMVVVGNGHHNEENFPPYYYRDKFHGRAMHSKFYRKRDEFAEENVLVVGVGNSGGQIAVDISLAANMTYLSLRRGVYVVPHYLFGIRIDKVVPFTFDSWWFKKLLPYPLWQMWHTAFYKLFLHKRKELGMPKPDHWMMSSLPTLSENMQNRIGDGRLKIKPEVERIDGKRVYFVDGACIEVDSIIYSTGYNTVFPFFDKDFFAIERNSVPLFKRIFKPGIENLAFIGCFQAIAWGFLDIMERQSELVAEYIIGRYRLPDIEEQEAGIAHERKVIAREFLTTPRNDYEMHGPLYLHGLRGELRRGQQRAKAAGFVKPVKVLTGDGVAGLASAAE